MHFFSRAWSLLYMAGGVDLDTMECHNPTCASDFFSCIVFFRNEWCCMRHRFSFTLFDWYWPNTPN